MIKKYRIEGLHCPNCAKVLEQQLNKQKDIKKAEINFVKSTVSVEYDNLEKAYNQLVTTTKIFEPDAKIINSNNSQNDKKNTIINVILLFSGIIMTAFAFLLPMHNVLYWSLVMLSVIAIGYKTIIKAVKLLFKGIVNENLLVVISVFGAIAVGEHFEGIMVITLYTIGKIFESIALNKSKKSIESIVDIKPEIANLYVAGKTFSVSPYDVHIGSIILVKAGERVALDGVVVEGNATLNMQNLTGESLPIEVKENDEIMSGSVVINGTIKIRVEKEFENSTVSKIIDMIENAEKNKSKTETIVSKIAKWYTLGVIVLAFVVFGLVSLITKDFSLAIYRGLIFLVVSCPCAFAISVPLSYFSGLGNASRHGILVKGSNYLDALAKVNVVAFDKTGTLTTGEFSVENVEVLNENFSKEDIILLAGLAEQYSVHPLSKAILQENKRDLFPVENVKEVAGEGIYYSYKGNDYFVGRSKTDSNFTQISIVKNNSVIGNISFKDTIKEATINTIKQLKNNNIKVVLLSGDKKNVVEQFCKEIGIEEYYYELLPNEKYALIDKLKNKKSTVAYVGDGLNDAPSLACADLGISMGIKGATASVETSDVVIVDDDTNNVHKGIKIAKNTRKIVFENIIFSAIIKVVFLTLGSLGITGMLWAVVADVGVTILAILNSVRAFKKIKQ